jgi:hypothetical protein
MKTDKFVEKYDRAVAASDRVARAIGYGESMNDSMRLDVATAWAAVVREFESMAAEVMATISRASGFIGDASPLTERVDVLKKLVAEANTAEHKRSAAATDARYQGRA